MYHGEDGIEQCDLLHKVSSKSNENCVITQRRERVYFIG